MSSIANLPSKVRNALTSVDRGSPYPRFEIESVLEDSEYDKLLKEFPDDLLADLGDEHSATHRISSIQDIPETVSESWKSFLNQLLVPELKKDLVEACFEQTFRRYPTVWRWLTYLRLRKLNNYEMKVAISGSIAGRYLPPHTDKSYKVLALVLYFAPRDFQSTTEGTRFYRETSFSSFRTAIRRFNRLRHSWTVKATPVSLLPMTSCALHPHSGILNSAADYERERWFYQNFENDYSVRFQANSIAGFIKTNNSFHAVDMRSSSFSGIRRSVLINLNIKHSLVVRVWHSLRFRILRIGRN